MPSSNSSLHCEGGYTGDGMILRAIGDGWLQGINVFQIQ